MKDLVLEQLHHLAGTLTVLRGRVRDAVAGEVSKAVADSVAEVLTAALSGRFVRLDHYAGRYDPFAGRRSGAYGRSDWDDPDADPWPGAYGTAQASSAGEDLGGEAVDPSHRVPAALAMALTAGRWWLVRGRSPWGAAGVGLVVGGALLAGGPIARTVLGVLWTVQRLLAATDALGAGAKALDRV